MHGDSKMYQEMELYIENILTRDCKSFYLVRGDVWIDAVFRALKTKDYNDKEIAKKIWKDQKNKKMLMGLFIRKSGNILLRKLRLIE